VTKAFATALLAALALAACQQPPAAPEATESAAAPEAKPGIAMAAGRLVLPAVAGNPGAAYFEIDNRSSATVSIAGIAIDGVEKTEMHQTVGSAMAGVDGVEIAPGTSMTFEPGKLHVMAFNLAKTLKPGGTTEMTVTFADGDKVSTPLKIEPAGGAGMGGMDH
jgi:periplasmic copper chaperone A